MRYYELLVEYKTDITKGNYGQKILDRLNIQGKINSGLGKGKNAVDMPSTRNDYNDLALTVMGIPFSPNWGTTPPFSLVTQELYDENKNKIVDEILKVFESFDPTTNKQYTQYIVKWFLVEESMAFPDIEDGRSTLKQAFDDFYRMKARIPEKDRGMDQYKSPREFVDSIQALQQQYGKKEKLPEGEKELIYTSNFVDVYWPIDEEGACYLGQGTQWCTSSTKSANYFKDYNKSGPLVIFNFKKPVTLGDPFSLELTDDTVDKIQGDMKVLGNDWSLDYFADVRDSSMDFDELYVDKNFHAMWNDLKFQSALGKVADAWKINRESLK